MSDQITIRMYRSGLGDCFLLAFPRGQNDPPFYLLIDCGVFFRTKGEEVIMREVAQQIFNTTKHIDLLVVTHEHYDHISGFNHAKDIFQDMEIDRIWFAWTEDPR